MYVYIYIYTHTYTHIIYKLSKCILIYKLITEIKPWIFIIFYYLIAFSIKKIFDYNLKNLNILSFFWIFVKNIFFENVKKFYNSKWCYM